MIVGFTGTRRGMTDDQITTLKILIDFLKPTEFRHGDCVGADAEAHICIRVMNGRQTRSIAHPPVDEKFRAFTDSDVILRPFPYIERNHHIVDMSDLMLACPQTFEEEQRSGTWATVRYARKEECPVYVIQPDGRA